MRTGNTPPGTPRANAAQRPATTSQTHAGAAADVVVDVPDDDIPGPRGQPVAMANERSPLLELTHVDPQDEQPHYDIRGTAVGSSDNDVIVNMRDDHIEVTINLPPRLLEGFDSPLFTHLTNLLGIADIAHLSEVSRATHALTLRVPAAQLQQQRWTQLQQQWATNHQQMIAPLQSQLSALQRAAYRHGWCYGAIPACMIFVSLASVAVGIWAAATKTLTKGVLMNDEWVFWNGTAIGCIIGGIVACVACCICFGMQFEVDDADTTAQKKVIKNLRKAQATFDKDNRSSLAGMREEPMPERFNVPVLESMVAMGLASADKENLVKCDRWLRNLETGEGQEIAYEEVERVMREMNVPADQVNSVHVEFQTLLVPDLPMVKTIKTLESLKVKLNALRGDILQLATLARRTTRSGSPPSADAEVTHRHKRNGVTQAYTHRGPDPHVHRFIFRDTNGQIAHIHIHAFNAQKHASSSGPARPAPLSREQQRQNMALIVSRHQIWQILTRGGYEIPFNPDVAYPGDRSEPTASTDPQINALFSDEDALVLVARELSRRPDVPEPSSDPSPAGERQKLLEPEPEQPSQSVASTTGGGSSSSSISSAGAGSGWSARTELESRRKLIVELLQRQGYDAEYEVGRAYPGDGTRTVPPDADFLSYGPLFSAPQALAMIRTYVTQAGAQRQPAAVQAADDGLPVATSIEHAEQLQREGYEVKFHLPNDDAS